MLISRQLANSVQVVDKIKRKVRLAAGLNEKNILSDASIERGLQCIRFFAERLQDIPPENVRIVATATIRLAVNRSIFLEQANQILGYEINILSGEQEAKLIYLGVAHTSCCQEKRLVVDIGGASTELIVGAGLDAKKVTSLNVGCVTFIRQYFINNQLNPRNFQQAITAAKKEIAPIVNQYSTIGWQSALGGSGTMQALAEILMAQHKPILITESFLHEIKQRLIQCQTIDNIAIEGLAADRSPVIASGLAILIAIFESFNIRALKLSSGALREGLLYEMLPINHQLNIKQRTIKALMQCYHVDEEHALRVKSLTINLFDTLSSLWQLDKDASYDLLLAACELHEIGLLLSFKHHQKHGAYIVEHAELPGFDQAERQLLKAFIMLQRGNINESLLQQSVTEKQKAKYLLAILRIAILICGRRNKGGLPDMSVSFSDVTHLNVSSAWLTKHPLIADELNTENEYLSALNIQITIK